MRGLRTLLTVAMACFAGAASAQIVAVPVGPIEPVEPARPGTPDIHLLGPASALPAKARVNVFLQVVNLGPGGIHDVNVLVSPGTSGLVIVGQIDRDLEDLPENESAAMAVRVATPDTAGGATLALTFSFLDDAGNARSVTRVVSIQIAPPVSDPLVLTYEGAALAAGEQGNVTLTVSNPSKERITNLDLLLETQEERVSLTQTSELTPGAEGSEILKGATLLPGETRRLDAPIVTSLAAEDLQRFTVKAQYTYQGFARDQSFDFGARISGDVRLRVLEARQVPTASGLVIEGTLVNTGTGTAWNPRVDVTEGSGLRATGGPKLVEDLEPNDAVDFRILVERVRPATQGAPLLVVDWNDDHGEMHALDVQGSATPPPPAPQGSFTQLWRFLASPVALILLMLLVLAGVVASLIHARHLHQQHVDEGTARAWKWERRGPRKPRGKGGARPGG